MADTRPPAPAAMRIASVALLLALAAPALAQDPIPDTTSAWRYYPLQVGNVWQYDEVEEGPYGGCWSTPCRFLAEEEVVSDTLVGGQRYFVIVKTRAQTYRSRRRRRRSATPSDSTPWVPSSSLRTVLPSTEGAGSTRRFLPIRRWGARSSAARRHRARWCPADMSRRRAWEAIRSRPPSTRTRTSRARSSRRAMRQASAASTTSQRTASR